MSGRVVEAGGGITVERGFCTDEGTAADATTEVVAKGALFGVEDSEP